MKQRELHSRGWESCIGAVDLDIEGGDTVYLNIETPNSYARQSDTVH